MQCLLRRSGSTALIAGMSKVRFSELRRTVPTTCRAVLLTGYGGPEVLELRYSVKIPELKPNEVLVRARAVAVDEFDQRIRRGYYRKFTEPHLPLILGRDISGEVAAVGNSVRSFSVGQEVFGALSSTAFRGTYTDYAILEEDNLVPKPASISHAEASVIAYSGLTAWCAISIARMKPGQRLFVLGEGVVALSAIQLAVATGCRVTAMCNGPIGVSLALGAGAEEGVLYSMEYNPTKFDAALDTVCAIDTEILGIKLLKRGGHFMTLKLCAPNYIPDYGRIIGITMTMGFLLKRYLRSRWVYGIRFWALDMLADPKGLHELARLADIGKLRIPVAKKYKIEEVREAHEAFDTCFIVGKIVLEFD